MNYKDFIENIESEIQRVSNSNLKEQLSLTIENYILYNNFFANLQKINSKNGKVCDCKMDALNFLNMHSTFLINSFIKDIIVNNYFSAKSLLRIFHEFYFKFIFILSNDKEVAELFLSFNVVSLKTQMEKFDLQDKKYKNKINELMRRYNQLVAKYKIPNDVKENYWIKIALKLIDKKNHSKSIQDIIEWLDNQKLIDKNLKISYEENCNITHLGISSLHEQQVIDKYDEANDFYKIYISILCQFNYILYLIIYNYMVVYERSKDKNILDKLEKNTDLIFQSVGSD